MRILLLTEFFPPIIGGVERHVQNLGLGLIDRGHEVTVATVHHEGAPERETVDGIHVVRLRATSSSFDAAYANQGKRYLPPVPDPGIVRGLRKLAREFQPDIVHAHNWIVHSYLPLKRPGGPRLVLTLHDYSLVCAKKSLMLKDDVLCSGPGPLKCLRCAAGHYGTAKGMAIAVANAGMGVFERHLVDLFVPVSRSVADGVGLPASGLPYRVIPNFVPDDVAASAAHGHPALPGLPDRYLLFVGALGRHKGTSVLLEAYQKLRDPWPLVMLGMPWPDMPKRFPPGVIVLKNVPHTAVMEAMTRCIALLVPSIYRDACPTVAMEAMASGKPVIASDIGGLSDIVADEETGLLVPHGDAGALAGAIERLTADEALRDQMGDAGRHRVGLFSASSVVERMDLAYQSLLEGRACP